MAPVVNVLITKKVPASDIDVLQIEEFFNAHTNMFYDEIRGDLSHTIRGYTNMWVFNTRVEIYSKNGIIDKLDLWDG